MSTTNKVRVSVGSLADMGKRFAGAWNRAASGDAVDETHITFLNVQTAPWDELQASVSLMAN